MMAPFFLVTNPRNTHLGSDRPGETSRLVFSQHQLLEICALFGTLISDLDGIYDPASYK